MLNQEFGAPSVAAMTFRHLLSEQCYIVQELSVLSIRHSFISPTHFKGKSRIFTETAEMAVQHVCCNPLIITLLFVLNRGHAFSSPFTRHCTGKYSFTW